MDDGDTRTLPPSSPVDIDDGETVLPNMVPADETDAKDQYYFAFPPWPRVPGMLKIDQFVPTGLQRQPWPAGHPKPEGEGDDSALEDDEDRPEELDGNGTPTVNLNVQHSSSTHKVKKRRKINKKRNKKPRAPRLQMQRRGIIRTEDLFGPGGWEGPENIDTRGKEPYDEVTSALLRLQRARKEYASSRVHVINREQYLMQIWDVFVKYAQLEKREEAAPIPDYSSDIDSDSDSDLKPDVGFHPEGDLGDEEEETSRFLEDMVGTVRAFLSSVMLERGMSSSDLMLAAAPQVVWSFVKYVKAHGVLMESQYAQDFAAVQQLCEQAREELPMALDTRQAFTDGFNLVCLRVWGSTDVIPPWLPTPSHDEDMAESITVDIAPALAALATDDDDNDTDVKKSSDPSETPTPVSGESSVDDLQKGLGASLAWGTAASASSSTLIDANSWTTDSPAWVEHQQQAGPAVDTWDPNNQPEDWMAGWDVSEFSSCDPSAFLKPLLDSDTLEDWTLVAEQDALFQFVAVGEEARAQAEVADHFLLSKSEDSLVPIILRYWFPTPAPFATSAPTDALSEEAFMSRTEGSSEPRVLVWMESSTVAQGSVRAGMGMNARLNWVKKKDGTAHFWFVGRVRTVISNYWLATSTISEQIV